MKKNLLIISILFIVFSACGDDGSTITQEEGLTVEDTYRDQMIKKYGIKEDGGLTIIKAEENKNVIFFEGRINNRLWISCYNKESKVNLVHWEDSEELKKYIKRDLGYGEKDIISIDRYRSYKWLYSEDSFIFQLIGDHANTSYYTFATHDVYFISQNKLINKISHDLYPSKYYGELFSWYKGAGFKIGDKFNYYDANGNVLEIVGDFSKTNFEFINYYECIDIDKDRVRRLNYKDGTVTWRTKSPLADIPNSARRDSIGLEKNKNIWTYTFYYTRYEGGRINRDIELNIETGEYKILDI